MTPDKIMLHADRMLPVLMSGSLPRVFLDAQNISITDPGMQVDTRVMDRYCYVVPIEPNAISLPVDFQRPLGEPVWAVGARTALQFQQVESPEQHVKAPKTFAELDVLMREYGAAPLLEQENKQFLRHAASAASVSTFREETLHGKDVRAYLDDLGTAATLGTTNSLVFNHIVLDSMMTRLMQKQVQLRSVLMHIDTLIRAVPSLNLKSDLKVHEDGAISVMCAGILLRTPALAQMDCVKPGHLYGFGDKSALGKMPMLAPAKMHVMPAKDDATKFVVKSWEVIAMGIILCDACTVMLLADSAPLDVEVASCVATSGFIRLRAQ